jgi:DNA-binding CsgD family transcriptional regulator
MARVFAGRSGTAPLAAAIALAPASTAGMGTVRGRLFLRGADRTPPDPTLRATVEVGDLPHLLFHVGRDAATTDRWAAAEAAYTEAIELATEFGQPTEVAVGSAGLAWLLARQGRPAEVEAQAATAERLADRHQIPMALIWSRFARGDAALADGDAVAAATVYADLEDRVLTGVDARDVDLSPVPELVDALLRAGTIGRLPALAAGYRRRAQAKEAPWALARSARVDALLAADVELDAAFGRALELHRAAFDPFEEACTQLAYGARLRRARRRTDARGPLAAAVDTFGRLGARPWADRAADELVATGATVRRTEDAPTAALTARELQVAVLLAQGRTTRQAAQALFLSAKTVEYHLGHVYTKLGICSRAELAATLTPPVGPPWSAPPG